MISILRRAKKELRARQLAQPMKPLAVGADFVWPDGAAGAVSLTYDDGLECHYEKVAPQLEQADVRGTFYPHGMAEDFRNHTSAWRELAARGHELGNHTLFHPCRNNPGIGPEFDLRQYGERRWCNEMELANWMLEQVDGQTERTFGNTCWDNWIGPDEKPICLEQLIPKFFRAARGECTGAAVNPRCFNPYNLGTMSADGMDFETLQKKITTAAGAGQWLILSAHGVGAGTHKLFMSDANHECLLEWLEENRPRIWTAPLKTVVKHLLYSAEGKCEGTK